MSRGSVKRWRGSYRYAVRVDTTKTPRRQLQRRGFPTKRAAEEELKLVVALLDVAGGDEEALREVGDMLFDTTRWGGGGRLPTPDDVRRRLDADLNPAAPSMTVARWLDDWLEAKGDASESTRALLRHRVEAYFKPHLGRYTLERLSYRQVRAMFTWIDQRSEQVRAVREANRSRQRGEPVVVVPDDPLDVRQVARGVGDGTQRQLRVTLLDALGQAATHGLLPRQRFEMIREMTDLRKVRRRHPKVWSPEQVRQFLAFAYKEEPWLAPLYELAARRGLRRGELCGLRWGDVDWKAGYVRVERQRIGGDGAVVVTKTEGSDRDVPLGRELKATLLAYHLRRGRPGDDVWLFTDRSDRAPRPPNVTFRFNQLARDAGLPTIRLHDLRHSAATMMLEEGVPVKVVSTILGHSRVQTTMDTYQAVTRASLDGAAERLDALLADPDVAQEVGS